MRVSAAWVVCAALLLTTGGCFEKQYRSFRYQVTAESPRQLYDPMTVGQAALTRALPHVACRQEVYVLAADGTCVRQQRPLAQSDLVDESRVVFFRPLDPRKAGGRLFCFSPRRLRLQKLVDADGRLLVTGVSPANPVATAAGRFALFRSLQVGKDARRRVIVRQDFFCDAQGGVHPAAGRRLTSGRYFDTMPEPDAAGRRVIFVRRKFEDQNRLMAVGFSVEGAAPVFAQQDFNVLYPYRLADGRIVFAGNPQGYYRLLRLTETPPGYAPLADAAALAPPSPSLMLANADRRGGFQSAIVKLPDTYDLTTICALVQAQNPRINRMRALLGASLVDAGQARLANWPVLSFGLMYTPIVGIFLADPVVSSGDFLAEFVARGILGVVQPLLDFKKNAAISAARTFRVQIAHDNVLNEANERIAEAAELYFEARYLGRLVALQQAQAEVMGRRLAYYRRLRKSAAARLQEILATEQIIDGLESEIDFHRRRRRFLVGRLKRICGLSDQTPFALSEERFAFEAYKPEPLVQMRTTALLHHPSLKAARAALSEAFYKSRAGSPLRPTAYFTSEYAQSRRYFTDPVDDYITMAIWGRYPLAAHRSRELSDAYWRQAMRTLQLQRRIQAQQVVTGMEEAYLDFLAARRDFVAKRSSQLFRLEQLRTARLYKRLGPAGDVERADPIAPLTARFDYLQACIRTAKVRRDLGLRYARLWREMGLSSRLAQEAALWRRPFYQHNRYALWLWRTRDVLTSTDRIRTFVRFCRDHRIRRIYAYLYSDSLLLTEDTTIQRLILLLNFCHRWDIEVWALLGEPEWLLENDTAAVCTAVTRIEAFNSDLEPFEPRIAGIKLDLEPHSLPGWHSDADRRRHWQSNYLHLLQTAGRARTLPLWVDIPVQFFRPENQPLLQALSARIDGATLMAYFNKPARITQSGLQALAAFSKPLEIGVELSGKAPAGDHLPLQPWKAVQQTLSELRSAWIGKDDFVGIALHDYRALEGLPAEKNAP